MQWCLSDHCRPYTRRGMCCCMEKWTGQQPDFTAASELKARPLVPRTCSRRFWLHFRELCRTAWGPPQSFMGCIKTNEEGHNSCLVAGAKLTLVSRILKMSWQLLWTVIFQQQSTTPQSPTVLLSIFVEVTSYLKCSQLSYLQTHGPAILPWK